MFSTHARSVALSSRFIHLLSEFLCCFVSPPAFVVLGFLSFRAREEVKCRPDSSLPVLLIRVWRRSGGRLTLQPGTFLDGSEKRAWPPSALTGPSVNTQTDNGLDFYFQMQGCRHPIGTTEDPLLVDSPRRFRWD